MKISLRPIHFIRLLAVPLLLLLILSPLAPPRSPAHAQQASGSTLPDATLSPNLFSPEQGAGSGTPLAGDSILIPAGAAEASFISAAIATSRPFSHLLPHYVGEVPKGGSVGLDVRFGKDGQNWGDWQPTDLEDVSNPLRDRAGERFVNLVTVPRSSDTVGGTNATASFAQARLRLRGSGNLSPRISKLTLSFIDAGNSGAVTSQPAGGQKPPVISRSSWGAPDGQQSPTWLPLYQQATHIIIHQTGTSNTATDWAAEVRALWFAQAKVRGWGDLGYNFLIDPLGNIYEGRAGGDNVVGGAAYPFSNGSVTVALLGSYLTNAPSDVQGAALVRLLGWKVNQLGLDPQGSSKITAYLACGQSTTVDKPSIAGARDYAGEGCNSTFNNSTSPGDGVYNQLDRIRAAIITAQPRYNALFLGTDSPTVMAAGGTYNVNLSVRNGGSLTWSPTVTNPVRLGYRWFSGDKLIEGGIQDFRASLPQAVPFGGVLSLYAKVNAPSTPGNYTLLWDMVEENVTWFYEQGSTPLRLAVSVVSGNAGAGDTAPPVSRIFGLKPYQTSEQFIIRWSGLDDAGGSGIFNYDVQYKIAPNGEWQTLVGNSSANEAGFSGKNGYTYYFRVRARDRAGNTELFRNTPDAYTTVDVVAPNLAISRPLNGAIQPNGAITVTGEVEPGALVMVNGKAAQVSGGSFTATLTTTQAGRNLVVSAEAIDGAGNSSQQAVIVRLQSNFSDVERDNFAREAIIYVADRKIMAGYSDGSFRPGSPLIRSEAVRVAVLAAGGKVISTTRASFSDVPTNDASFAYIETAVAKGVISGTDGQFKPKEAITRADFLRLLIGTHGYALANPNKATFTDISNSAADYQYVETAVKNNLLPPSYLSGSTFDPTTPITRAEAAWMLRQSFR